MLRGFSSLFLHVTTAAGVMERVMEMVPVSTRIIEVRRTEMDPA